MGVVIPFVAEKGKVSGIMCSSLILLVYTRKYNSGGILSVILEHAECPIVWPGTHMYTHSPPLSMSCYNSSGLCVLRIQAMERIIFKMTVKHTW